MRRENQVGIVCCSNGFDQARSDEVDKLIRLLTDMDITPVISEHIYAVDGIFAGRGRERAAALMRFYENEDIRAVFDISGGDIANEILPYLDFELLRRHPKRFWGYSDLTSILNAVYTKTGHEGVLYQVMNLVWDRSGTQQEHFAASFLEGADSLFDFPYHFIQGNYLEGIVVGGNVRCFLKLAGTAFFPDLTDKILLMESLGGGVPQFVTFLSQMKCMGVFEKIRGIVLGTFTQMETEGARPDITTLVQEYAGNLPIVKTSRVGHGKDSCGVVIGAHRIFA